MQGGGGGCKGALGRNHSARPIAAGPRHPTPCIVASWPAGPGRALSRPLPGPLSGQMLGATV